MSTKNKPQYGVKERLHHGYDDDKPDDEHEDRGRTYCGYEPDILESRALNRYRFSLAYVKEGDICLDAACGSGYGTVLISEKAKKVIGLEISDHALEYARNHHNNEKIEYQKADITRHIDYPEGFFNVIISIETLEHVTRQEEMLGEFFRVLKKGGLLIATTVDHEVYSILGGIKNKHHVGELTKQELLELVGKYFTSEELYGQIEYQPLSSGMRLYKNIWFLFMKIIRRMDVFRLRFFIMRLIRIEAKITDTEQSFNTMIESDIEKIDLNGDEKYYQLLLVARKL